MEFATFFKMTLVVSMLVMSVSGLHGQGSSAYNAAKGPNFASSSITQGSKTHRKRNLQFGSSGDGRNAAQLSFGGGPGQGASMHEAKVNPIDGGWSQDFGPCSAACGGNTGTKSKTCNNPKPEHGGSYCPGEGTEDCTNNEPCPVSCTTHGQCAAGEFCHVNDECYPCTMCRLCADGIDKTCGGCDEHNDPPIYPTDDSSHDAGTCVSETRVEVVCSSLGCEECVAAGDHGCAYAGTNCMDMATMTEDLMMNMIDKCPDESADVERPALRKTN